MPGLVNDFIKCIKDKYGMPQIQSNSTKKERKNFSLRKILFEIQNENMTCFQPRKSSDLLTRTNEIGNIGKKVGTLKIFIK